MFVAGKDMHTAGGIIVAVLGMAHATKVDVVIQGEGPGGDSRGESGDNEDCELHSGQTGCLDYQS